MEKKNVLLNLLTAITSVTILNVTEFAVILKCEHNGKSKEIEIVEPSYMDIYNTVYHFLSEAVLNAEESEEESNMEI